ncbi:fungal-specific transcription factor domain-containing protein [Podospora conica]|nr:fungal-specific transcription factor domain-containing protein [Schizothecium conicum]
MGLAPYLDLRNHLAVPDTPPEILTPDSSTFSVRQSEERSWNQPAPLSPPMSNYDPSAKGSDMSAGKGPDEAQVRRHAGDSTPRETLPPLSSLFGPPPTTRPFHSDHQGPGPYASASPLDRPHVSGLPPSSSSYFPPVSSISQPPRSAPDSRIHTQYPPLFSSFSSPNSPRPREPEYQRSDRRSDYGGGAKWPSREDGHRDYSFGPEHRKSAPERFSGPSPTLSRAGDDAREQLPRTPASPVTTDIVLSKDGLGPKIWTGTHFLPRFVKAQEMPGEGMCYFYDDGTHCKTVIDGEAVNAHWGVTKAGKPRKRLAIACVTCREKKIKCDPDYPRCVQCEKFGRVCTFKNAPRGGHNTSPSTPPAEPEDPRRLGGLMRVPPDHMRPMSHNSSESMSPRAAALRPGSPDLGPMPAKRMRVDYDHYPSTAGPRSPMAPTPDTARSTLSWRHPELPRIHEDVLHRAWQTDPYVSDPPSVTSTVASFFAHTDAAALRFLPEKAFTSWVQNSAHRKSPEDQMLVYSILAVGVVLSGGPRDIAFEYSQVARYAAGHAALSLQLVQTRLLLALYYQAVSRPGDGHELLSGAISAATGLQLNLELGHGQAPVPSVFPFGLSRAGFAECRRRTFWSCFVMERLNGLFPTRLAIINSDDIFACLPSDLRSFEEQRLVPTPAFEPHFSSLGSSRAGVGIMAYLVELTAIWGDVMTTIYRLSYRGSNFDYAQFHRSILSRLDDWKASLPRPLEFSPANLSTTAREDQGTLILLHLVYHLTMTKLHRHVPQQSLTKSTQLHHAWTAQEHARRLLDVVRAVANDSAMGRGSMPPPLTSFAILEAVDVLSAEGAVHDLPRLVDGLALAHSVVEVLGSVWEDAKVHRMAMDHRLDKLVTLREREAAVPGLRVYADEGKGLRWQMAEPLETRFPRDMDCVYTAFSAAGAGYHA